MDGKSKTINKAGYIVCSVSYRSNGEDWQDGSERAFKIEDFKTRFGRIPKIGQTVVDHLNEDEVNYTRVL